MLETVGRPVKSVHVGIWCPRTVCRGLGVPVDGHVCQIVLLRRGQRMLNDDDAHGTEDIQ